MSSMESIKSNISTSENTSTSDNNQPTVQSYLVNCESCKKEEVTNFQYTPGISHYCNDCCKNLIVKKPPLYRIHADPGVICQGCNERFNKHYSGSGGILCTTCYDLHTYLSNE